MSLIPAYRPAQVDAFGNFQRFLDRFFTGEPGGTGKLTGFDWSPAVDIVAQKDAYRISVDLPGVDPKDVAITVDNGELSIRGERQQQKSEDKDGARIVETNYGSFARTFSLPPGITGKDIKASTKHGVLQIEVPKAKEAQAERVTIATS